jgi:dipeptidyl-peptidase-4
MMRNRSKLALLCALMFATSARPQQKKMLTVEDFVRHPQDLYSMGARHASWRPGTDQVSYLVAEGKGAEAQTVLHLMDAASGSDRVLYRAAVKDHKVVLDSYIWSPRGNALLVRCGKEYCLLREADGTVKQITHDGGEKEDADFSPDASRLAFVKGGNIDVLNLTTGRARPLTTDGNGTVMNGKLDWVYEEEMANRATGRAYEWSPDGRMIAYLRLDDGPVPQYPITDYLQTHATIKMQRFPQPGDANPAATFHVVTVRGSAAKTWNFPLPKGTEYLGPGFSWTLDSRRICVLTMNRDQTDLQVHAWDPVGGNDRVLVKEHDPYWINSLDPPHFLADGKRFLWLSERDGWLHLYLFDRQGRLLKQLTHGPWMIDHPFFVDAPTFQVDEKSGWIYFVSTRKDPRQRQLERVRIDGQGLEQISKRAGEHSLDLSPNGEFLVDVYSNPVTPPVFHLRRASGEPLRILGKPVNHLGEYEMAATEFVEVKARDGSTLYARMAKPLNFDPAKKYPVVVYVYGGPHAQMVRDGWGVTSSIDQILAEKGYITWTLDNHGSWGRGHAFETPIFKNMGAHEMEDQLAGVDYLKTLPYVDTNRIGVWVWSYGGYFTLYLLTHAPQVFKCGVAGAPVTDWKFYDSIYTERYMRTPQQNPEGYKTSSPLAAASRLRARLLVIHGTSDDNVHMQNSINFIQALIQNGIPYSFYMQPGQKHGFAGVAPNLYRMNRIVDFFAANL